MKSNTFKYILGLVFLCAVSLVALPLEARCTFNFGFGAIFQPRPCVVYQPVVYQPVAPCARVMVGRGMPSCRPERVVVVRDRYYAPRPCYQNVQVYEYNNYYGY